VSTLCGNERFSKRRKYGKATSSSIVHGVVRYGRRVELTVLRSHLHSPFSSRDNNADASQTDDEQLLSLLRACCRTKGDDLDVPRLDDITCIEKELDQQRLNKVFGWLWVAGRPIPPRSTPSMVWVSKRFSQLALPYTKLKAFRYRRPSHPNHRSC
jgi:hypothetical protein